jgi:hypothetical protein
LNGFARRLRSSGISEDQITMALFLKRNGLTDEEVMNKILNFNSLSERFLNGTH